jgi:predicted RNA binding protein YcfA (HicA-like mRNA interferase family)
MTHRPIPTKCWEKFLTLKGFTYKRTKGSHDQWTKPGHRTIPVWGDEKLVPADHLKTGCKSIGIDPDELYNWVANNC